MIDDFYIMVDPVTPCNRRIATLLYALHKPQTKKGLIQRQRNRCAVLSKPRNVRSQGVDKTI
ncbi:hypothetical protein NBRC116597_42440 [Phaeobacter sp. NW0010-22]